jgi:hypothetical protein
MDPTTLAKLMNELLTLEQRNLARRLLESAAFVTSPSIDEWSVVQRVARTSREHEASLVEALVACGGVPGLRAWSADTADLHYQELHHALPRLVAWYEDAINTYTHAAKRVEGELEASRVISEILESHRQELMSLRQLGRLMADSGRRDAEESSATDAPQ